LPAFAAVVPIAVAPDGFFLSLAEATKINGTVPGAAGV